MPLDTSSSPRFTTLDAWLAWMERLHPQEIELGLARIQKVAHALGIDKGRAKVVTVAGTNGKGSCIATLECCLRASGQRVGCYTSPHMQHYQERVRIDGLDVSEHALCEVFDRIDSARETISLTYFEFGTLAAMLLFQQADVDVWLLEVGLGGRLDAVNIIDPDIAVITSIDLDHQDWLGDTRDQIAQEKLGILRPGIACVCAEARLTPSMEATFASQGVDLYLINRDFSITTKENAPDCEVSVRHASGPQSLSLPRPRLPLPSVAAALQVMALCQSDFDLTACVRSCESLRLAGRFETLAHQGMSFVLDVAHNPAATRLLAETLHIRQHGPHFGVVAMMADKDIDESLRPLLPHVAHWLVCACDGVARSAPETELARSLRGLGVADDRITLCHTVEEALAYSIEQAQPYEKNKTNTTLVFGSFYTVAAAKTYLQSETTPSEIN